MVESSVGAQCRCFRRPQIVCAGGAERVTILLTLELSRGLIKRCSHSRVSLVTCMFKEEFLLVNSHCFSFLGHKP